MYRQYSLILCHSTSQAGATCARASVLKRSAVLAQSQPVLTNPSQITACVAKVVIVISKVKLLNADINITKITLYVKVTQSEIS